MLTLLDAHNALLSSHKISTLNTIIKYDYNRHSDSKYAAREGTPGRPDLLNMKISI